MDSPVAVRPRFVEGAAGQLLITTFSCVPPRRGVVLFSPPFAEEMNRVRRMMSLQARSLAGAGYDVVIVDLYGTGDSAGDFAEGRWSTWVSDLDAALKDADLGESDELWLIGIRLGALLAVESCRRMAGRIKGVVFWSPCPEGKVFMSQFLRLRLLAGLIARQEDPQSVADLRGVLDGGESLEVAGYLLTPELVGEIDSKRLDELCVDLDVPMYWFETVAAADRPAPPAAARYAGKLRERSTAVDLRAVVGPPYYATPEISIAPDLIDATTRLIRGH